MKKVVIYVNSLARGGAEHVSVILSQYLVNNNYECIIITERKCEKEYNVPKGVERLSLWNHSNNNKDILKNIIKLRKILKRLKPDVMLVMDIPACLYSIPASRFLNIKVVV